MKSRFSMTCGFWCDAGLACFNGRFEQGVEIHGLGI
jgi:hypothetical protein